jgi:hypothetical protein
VRERLQGPALAIDKFVTLLVFLCVYVVPISSVVHVVVGKELVYASSLSLELGPGFGLILREPHLSWELDWREVFAADDCNRPVEGLANESVIVTERADARSYLRFRSGHLRCLH